jgi:hypothetical protein
MIPYEMGIQGMTTVDGIIFMYVTTNEGFPSWK